MQATNLASTLDKDGDNGPYTVFVPSNEALLSMKTDDLRYLLSPEVPGPACPAGIGSASLPQSVSCRLSLSWG